jgi:hypothetical protein
VNLNPGKSSTQEEEEEEEDSFHLQFGLKFKEETNEILHFEQSFVWC